MSLESYDVGVVGVGFIGELHATLYSEHPRANLEVLVDIDEDRARESADTHDVPHIETSVQDAVARHDIDAVTIATPEDHHRAPTEAALEQDVAVLLEKPIAASVEDARAIGTAVEAADAPLMIGYVCRFHPQYAALKARIDDGELGELYGLQAARVGSREIYDMVAEWTNPIYYNAMHDIDMLRWYVGEEVESVYAQGSAGRGDQETPVVVHTTMRFENGVVAGMETNWGRVEGYPTIRTDEIRATGTEGHGRVVMENDDATLATASEFEFLDAATLHGRHTDMYRYEVEHFVDTIGSDAEPLVTWEDGLRTLEIANAILDSLESGRREEVSHA